MKTACKLVALLFILPASLYACAPGVTQPPLLTPVAVQLRWTHQAQFAGFYAADQNGYFANERIAVSFIEGGPNIDFMKPVLDQVAQFGIANADALISARAEGKTLKAIATIYRRSPSVYIAMASSGITRPQDFVGKKIQTGFAGVPLLHAMTARVGVRPDQYTVVDSTPDLSAFYMGNVQVRSVFLTNEVLQAQAAGYKLNIIYPDDYGIHFYSDSIFTTDNLIAANPGLVSRFLRASLKGWTYAVENPTAIAPMVLKYNPTADRAHEAAFMASSLPLANTGEDHIGWMKPEVWAGMERTLREQGVLTKPVTVADVYTVQFLKEIYP